MAELVDALASGVSELHVRGSSSLPHGTILRRQPVGRLWRILFV